MHVWWGWHTSGDLITSSSCMGGWWHPLIAGLEWNCLNIFKCCLKFPLSANSKDPSGVLLPCWSSFINRHSCLLGDSSIFCSSPRQQHLFTGLTWDEPWLQTPPSILPGFSFRPPEQHNWAQLVLLMDICLNSSFCYDISIPADV